MELDSVRSLKEALSATVLRRLNEPARAQRFLLSSASPIRRAASAQPSIALGITRDRRRGAAFKLAVRVQQRSLEGSRELDAICERARHEVDVGYVGRVVARALPWHQQRQRPLRIGCSIGHFQITAGTLGCFVRDRVGGTTLILSNNHVLADENRAKRGDVILQPGRADGGRRRQDEVGELERFVRLKRVDPNDVDCAVASIKRSIAYDASELSGIGRLKGLGDVVLDGGERVSKVGRTTGVTEGRVTAFEIDNLVVEFDSGPLRFDGQIEIEGADDQAFSQGGDSGSVIVNEDLRGVALLFAGADIGGGNGKGVTFANPLGTVLDRLRVNLET